MVAEVASYVAGVYDITFTYNSSVTIKGTVYDDSVVTQTSVTYTTTPSGSSYSVLPKTGNFEMIMVGLGIVALGSAFFIGSRKKRD